MLEITWLGHSTFQLRLPSGEVLLTDPWLKENPAHPKGFELSRVDCVLITHGHFDHIADAIAISKRFHPKFIANFEICNWLDSKGVANTSAMNKGGTQQAIAGISVTMTHALHSSGIADGDHTVYGGEACGYVLHFPDHRTAYFAGDTCVFSDMALIAELYQPALAFLPIGDLFTMDPRQAALACRLLNNPKVIPMHFGTFPPLTGRPDELARLATAATIWHLTPGVPESW
jgi:L-ascorbate metabolism protein UlaG (beta-lactamase superfamily)